MGYPILPVRAQRRELVETFGGYNHNRRIADGEFYHMENLSSDRYPLLCPRKQRRMAIGEAGIGAMLPKDGLCYTQGSHFVLDGYPVDLGLSPGEKTLTSLGAYVIILPDKKWINTLDLSQYGSVDASFTTTSPVSLTLCAEDGADYSGYASGPQAPEEGGLWLDTSGAAPVLKQYGDGLWTALSTFVKVFSPGLGEAFGVYDGVTLSGLEEAGLNGSHVLRACSRDYVVIPGILEAPGTQDAPVTLERKMPEVDFLVESGNRLWGCRYGLDAQGRVVNEIYASRLGDFKNWNSFLGTAADSYAASCGTDGPFTAATVYLGNPLFFKENCVHKVYGSYPAAFQIQTTQLLGVQQGSGGSLAQVGQLLYYKSAAGICAYDGSLPVEISQALGEEYYHSAVAGSHGGKYYVSMEDSQGSGHLFVLDTRRSLWHREDSLRPRQLCSWKGSLYARTEGGILDLLGGGEEEVSWMAQTGYLGLSSPDHKYLSRLSLRLQLAPGSELEILVRYDGSPHWQSLGHLRGHSWRSFSLPIRPRRCEHLELRLEGRGDMTLYSLCKTLEEGSDRR